MAKIMTSKKEKIQQMDTNFEGIDQRLEERITRLEKLRSASEAGVQEKSGERVASHPPTLYQQQRTLPDR